jgi:hypothetical protein
VNAGYSNQGYVNTFIGRSAGFSSTGGTANTYVGDGAGYNNTAGNGNVFLGYGAGYSESGSQRLYIDNCYISANCDTPFIYGEFDTGLLRIGAVTHVHTYGASKSQLHFSLDNGDYGGFLTSVLQNNFFMSSGARWDNNAGGWIQRSSDQQSVIQGSGSLGYRIFTSSGHAVNTSFTPTTRLLIDFNGLFALNANSTVAGHTSSGAYLTTTGVWTNASSREYKDNVHTLTAAAADKALEALDPVTFTYKNDGAHERVGFIAEDVPELVAMPDRKGLSPMDIVAVLTKVVQEQRERLAAQEEKLQLEQSSRESLEERLQQLAAEVARLHMKE